ncbi:MAG: hypothetical protein M1816_004727 [Peltula sp. TS41687]|nr:MAG: hypothetical protein M1816_004727 [Peltula sp. TS41687]
MSIFNNEASPYHLHSPEHETPSHSFTTPPSIHGSVSITGPGDVAHRADKHNAVMSQQEGVVRNSPMTGIQIAQTLVIQLREPTVNLGSRASDDEPLFVQLQVTTGQPPARQQEVGQIGDDRRAREGNRRIEEGEPHGMDGQGKALDKEDLSGGRKSAKGSKEKGIRKDERLGRRESGNDGETESIVGIEDVFSAGSTSDRNLHHEYTDKQLIQIMREASETGKKTKLKEKCPEVFDRKGMLKKQYIYLLPLSATKNPEETMTSDQKQSYINGTAKAHRNKEMGNCSTERVQSIYEAFPRLYNPGRMVQH